MIEGVCPFASTHALLRKFSTGTVEDEPQLWRSPNVWPTSCDDTNRISWPMSSSLKTIFLAAVSLGEACIIYQFLRSYITFVYQLMWLSMISPLRGSEILGPLALATSEGL